MPPSPLPTTLSRLRRSARTAAVRLRTRDVLKRALVWAPLPLVYALVALTVIKVYRLGPDAQVPWLWGAAVPLVVFGVAVVQAALRRRPAQLGALALDRYHGLNDRITNALSFAALPEGERTPLMRAAMADALRSVGRVSPARAAPLRVPRETWVVLLLVGGLVAVSLFEIQVERPVPPPPQVQPLVLSPDDIELFQELADELAEKTDDPESQAAVRQFNQLLEDIADQRLDRREVFRRLEELENKLVDGAQSDKDALDEGLKSLARELEQSDLAKPLAKAFEEKRLGDAEEALKKLAERLRDKTKPPSKDDLERLRKALEQASKESENREARISEAREAIQKEQKKLLNKKQQGKLSKQEEQQLAKNERELQRLDRRSKQARETRQKLSKLDRELAEAARQLMQEMGKSAEHLDAAAEDVNRMAKKEMSDKEKEELIKKLREMRELLRQQGQGGQEQMDRLMRFSRKARGQQGEGDQNGPGKLSLRRGQGSGDTPMPGEGSGQGRSGKGLLDKGEGQGKGQGKGEGQGAGAGEGEGQGKGERGEGAGRGGLEAGKGHDENLTGEASEIAGQTQDVTAAAVDTGQGEASSEVIMGAAERGFTGKGYRDVYVDYQQVAEDVINQDEIPPGYRFYVRRYFQLIRPRE